MTVEKAKNKFRTVTEGIWDRFKIRDHEGNCLVADGLTELADLLQLIEETYREAWYKYGDALEADRADVEAEERAAQNFAATGDPDVSAHDLYKYDGIGWD